MIAHRHLLIIMLATVGITANLYAMVYDNRFFPLYPHIYQRTSIKPSVVGGDIFFMLANDAAQDTDESVGIPEILGLYDQTKLANAIVELGRSNPFIGTGLEQFIGRSIPWHLKGKIDAQGVALAYNIFLTNNVSVGATLFAMHVFSRINFQLAQNSLDLTPAQFKQMDELRRSMQASVGLEAPKWDHAGFSDIDAYVRFGNIWNYTYKFRRIDAGLRTGLLIPTGVMREVNNPASVPFGGNGHWGAYMNGDLELELKEDWMVGLVGRISKRFEKQKNARIPIADEQPLFGAVFGQVRVDPGITFIAVPYIRLEDIRDGLGIQAKYTIVTHFDDLITDARFGDKMPEAQLGPWNNVTDWTSEYLTLNVFYDFSRVRVDKFYAPSFSFMWDIPIQAFLTERVSKTHRISLGIAFNF